MILIREYSESEIVHLTYEDLEFLESFHPKHVKYKKVSGGWTLISNYYVGHIKLPSGFKVVIEPKIPTNNLIQLIAYSYDRVKLSSSISLEKTKDTSPLNLYVLVFLNWIDLLIKKGSYKNYSTISAQIKGAKGKILISRNTLKTDKLWCEFQGLSYNNQHNSLIKSLLIHIAKLEIDPNLKSLSKIYARNFRGVNEVKLTPQLFNSIKFNRLNLRYQAILDLGHTIYSESRISSETGAHHFSGFMVNMNKVFENFVLKILQLNFGGFNIRRTRTTEWMKASNSTCQFIPRIEPDILVEKHLVLDAKYYLSPLTKTGKYFTPHIFQISTYMNHYKIDGVLVYPTNGQEFDDSYQIGNRNLKYLTFNLNGNLEESISNFVSNIRSLVAKENI